MFSNCRINISLRKISTMVEPGETRVKSEEGIEKKFAPKFNKKKNSGKNNATKYAD